MLRELFEIKGWLDREFSFHAVEVVGIGDCAFATRSPPEPRRIDANVMVVSSLGYGAM